MDIKTLEELGKSLAPLCLAQLKDMYKDDLIVLILTREKSLYEHIELWNESRHNKDREIFGNLREEIVRLHNILIDDSILYQQNVKLRENIKRRKKELEHWASKYQLLEGRKGRVNKNTREEKQRILQVLPEGRKGRTAH